MEKQKQILQITRKVYLDEEGYPTDEFLKFIKDYKPDENVPIIIFLEEIIKPNWNFSSWGFVFRKKRNGVRTLELHTGGWSGNESLINAITSNIYLTHFKMQYVMWRTGGHYYFNIKD